MLSWYIAKCKYAFKMIQIIAKLDEAFSHILNMNWLYHSNYNWKVWFIWFHIKHLDKFFIQTSILSVLEKTFCWKITFIWKMIRNLLEAFVSKSILYVYQNVRWSQRKIVPKKDYIFLPKVPPPVMCFHPWWCGKQQFHFLVPLWCSNKLEHPLKILQYEEVVCRTFSGF